MNRKKFEDFISEHKKEILIISGEIVLITLGSFMGYKYLKKSKITAVTKKCVNKTQPILDIDKNLVKKTATVSEELSSKTFSYSEPFMVKGHVRNLGNGKNPSERAIENAIKNNIELEPNQTYVCTFMKRCKAQESLA